MDWGELHEWALNDAIERGCSCEGEPEITLVNCEKHGVHAQHKHQSDCYLLLVANAEWN